MLQSASSLSFNSSQSPRPTLSIFGPLPYPQIQTPSCAWRYLKISVTLVSPSLSDLLPLLRVPLTFTTCDLNTPIPISSHAFHPAHPSQTSSSIMAAPPLLEYPQCLPMSAFSLPPSVSFLVFIIRLQEANFLSLYPPTRTILMGLISLFYLHNSVLELSGTGSQELV